MNYISFCKRFLVTMISADTESLTSIVRADRSDWTTLRFDQIAKNITDRVDDPAEAGVDYYVGLEHLDPESLKIRRWGAPTDVEATKLRFQSGDIIFGRRRAYQRKVAVAEFEGICSAHALVLRPRTDNVVPEFLPFFMQSDAFFDRALAISVGSLSPTINWKTLAQQEFLLPPKDEQRRIAEILGVATESLRDWQTASHDLDSLMSSVRETVLCHPARPRTTLGECISNIVPGSSVVGTNEPAKAGAYGVLKVSAVGPNGFDADENKRLIDPTDFRPEFSVRAGDLIMTRANTRELVGRVCLVPDDFPHLMLCDKTLRINIDREKSIPRFMLEVLRSTELRHQIESIASGTGGAMKNISQVGIRSLRVPMPPPSVQAQLVSEIESIHVTQAKLREHIQMSENLTSALREAMLFPQEPLKSGAG